MLQKKIKIKKIRVQQSKTFLLENAFNKINLQKKKIAN